MTKQLRLMDPAGAPGQQAPVQPHRRLDDHTRQVGLTGVREARAALAEANRRVAEREAERRERRDNELADLARTSRRTRLTSDGAGASDHKSAA